MDWIQHCGSVSFWLPKFPMLQDLGSVSVLCVLLSNKVTLVFALARLRGFVGENRSGMIVC